MALQVSALELRMLGMDLDRVAAAPCRQFHCMVQNQDALLRVVGRAHRAARSLGHRKIHALAGRCNAALLAEGEPAGLYVNFARRSRLGSSSQRLGNRLAAYNLARRHIGRNRRRHAWAHQRYLHRPGCGCRFILLVVFKLGALDAVHAAAVFSIQLNLHVVQQRVVVL